VVVGSFVENFRVFFAAAAPEAEDVLRVKPLEQEPGSAEPSEFDDVAALSGPSFPAGAAPRSSGGGLGIGGIPLAIGASFGGAVLGAVIWLVVAKVAGFEIGFVAWIVGVLAGAGMTTFTNRRGVRLGLLAAFFALCGIFMGKVFVAKWVLLPMMKQEAKNIEVTGEDIEELLADPELMFCVACLVLAENGEIDEELAWKAIAVEMTDDAESEAVEQTASARQRASELLDGWSESERRTAARGQAKKLLTKITSLMAESAIGLAIAFMATLSFLDLLWLFLALGSVFKLGSG